MTGDCTSTTASRRHSCDHLNIYRIRQTPPTGHRNRRAVCKLDQIGERLEVIEAGIKDLGGHR
jgi:hypothetical protein